MLWQPSDERARATRLAEFAASVGFDLFAASESASESAGYDALHAWSVAQPDAFWRAVWSYCGGVGDLGDAPFCAGRDKAEPSSARPEGRCAPGVGLTFFADARLNLAENYLAPRPGVASSDTALVFVGENGLRRTLTWAQLRAEVAATAAALRADGVGVGDRVAAMLPNGPEAAVLLLAAASIGAVFSSVSPDFGAAGVLDRFGQIEPTVLVACDGYHYNGKRHDTWAKACEVAAELGVARLVCAPYDPSSPPDAAVLNSGVGGEPVSLWADWVGRSADGLTFEPVSFDHPVYILYSSGTTGAPKCIVHRTGGALTKLYSELALHCDVRPGDVVFYFSTTGWMMWNWLIGALSVGATVVAYDGSPTHPAPDRLFTLADDEAVTLFGVSAKFIEGVMAASVRPAQTHSLATVRTITSTGSPLSPEAFRYVNDHVSATAHLASFSGGTDICGCFVTGNPTAPVHAGEIQVPALGLDVAVFDDNGEPLGPGDLGELVCTNAFVSVPLCFFNDPDGERMHAAYFERFAGVWHHGDFARWTSNGGMVIEGRSDAVLNPGGVRIGTAEIYRQVERVPEVAESVVIGQPMAGDPSAAHGVTTDVRVVLFVRLADGLVLDDELAARIRAAIRSGASPRHVPAVIAQVPVIPRTRSGKLVELAIRDVVAGKQLANLEAIDDPGALAHFADHPALR